MKMLDVQIALEELRQAREAWGKGRTEFFSGYDWVLTRLIHEGARNFLSHRDMAKALGVSPATIRAKMRLIGLDPKAGKRVLSQTASEALLENSALMGIEPSEMDLTSPLAYLPMGETLRKAYQDKTLARVTELVDDNESILNAGGRKCNACRLNDTWVDGHCISRLCPTNLEDRLYQVIVSRFEGMGEAWATDQSGDTLARAAAEEAARLVSGNSL